MWEAFQWVGFDYEEIFTRVTMEGGSLHRFIQRKRIDHELTEEGTHGVPEQGMRLCSKFYLDVRNGLRELEHNGTTQTCI